jgi:small neutral amino acid transporter SnatA (MarC family)
MHGPQISAFGSSPPHERLMRGEGQRREAGEPVPVSDLILALVCVASGGVHAYGSRIMWLYGARVSAIFFAVSGVVQLALALALIRNGAPGG